MPMQYVHPLWTRLYSATADIARITAETINHALQQREIARSMREIEEQQQQLEVLRFEEIEDEPRSSIDTDEELDDASVDSDGSFSEHIGSCASRVLRTPVLRPKQVSATRRLILNPSSKDRALIVDRTGAGKSLILYTAAISVAGITLVIIPLLALTANQLSRIKKAVQKYGAVAAYHLDDSSKHDVKEKIIPKMDSFDYESSTSILLLCSPQYIAENEDFRDALLRCRDREILRLIAIDEAHLYAMHGRSFRDAIRILARDFFAKIYEGDKDYYPLLLAMTATMPLTLLEVLHELTFVDWTKPCHQMRSSPAEFRQREIDMQFHITGMIGHDGLVPIVKHLVADNDAHVCVFVNFKSECGKWGGELESKLADGLIDIDVMQINGDMDKLEKFAFIRLFTTAIRLKRFHPRVLVATPAANTGIDQVLVNYVLSIGIPRCLTTLLQERGRNRLQGIYAILSDWRLWIKLLLSVLLPPKNFKSDENPDSEFVNSMITSRSPEKAKKKECDTSTNSPSMPLTPKEKHNNKVQQYNDLVEVLNFLFLPDLGCIHLRAEWYLHTGELKPLPPDWPNDDNPVCGNKCFVCNQSYVKDIRPIVYEGALEFLDSEHFSGRDALPYEVSHNTTENIPDKLWSSADWTKKVFGVKTVTKANVYSFFFQLVGTGILTFEWTNGGKGVQCVFGTDKKKKLKYKQAKYWRGIQFRSSKWGGESVSFDTIVGKK